MKDLTRSKLYAELKGKDGSGTAILYYTDTGISVTPESFDRVVALEKERYGLKLLEAQESDPSNALQLDLDTIVPAQVMRFMNATLLMVQVVHVTPDNVDDALTLVQSQPNFHSWCVE